MKRNIFLSLVFCLMSASAHGQARSTNPPQRGQAVAQGDLQRPALTEAQVQQQLQEIQAALQRVQQLQEPDRTAMLREVERAVARLQESTRPQRDPTLANVVVAAGQRGGRGAGGPGGVASTDVAGRRLVVRPSTLGGGLYVQVAGGAWWTDAGLVGRLGLTEDQRSRIERAFTSHRVNLEASMANLEKEEAQLARLLDTEPLDRNAVSGQIFRVTNARGEMERENAAMTLEMREQMTLAQWNQLQTLQPRASIMVNVPVTPGAPEIRQVPFPVEGGARGGGGRGQRGQQ